MLVVGAAKPLLRSLCCSLCSLCSLLPLTHLPTTPAPPLQKAREAVTMAFFKTIMLPHPALHGVATNGLKLLNSHTPVPKALIQSSLTPVLNQLRNTKALSVPFLQVGSTTPDCATALLHSCTPACLVPLPSLLMLRLPAQ